MKKIVLKRTENIIAVRPAYCSGPGWANTPIWIHITDHLGGHRTEAIQPEQQSNEMRCLFALTAAANNAMLAAVEKCIKREK